MGKFTKSTVLHLRSKHNFSSKYNKEVELLGCLERFVFTVSIVNNFAYFIGIWFGVKIVGRWTPQGEMLSDSEQLRGPVAINIFLIGNLISLIFAGLGAFVIGVGK